MLGDMGSLRAAARFLAERAELAAVLVFGSAAHDRRRPDSDIDLAILPVKVLDPLSAIRLAGDLEPILKTTVDLIDLTRVSPILVNQILRQGRVVAILDSRAYHSFVIKHVTAYEDLKRARKPIEAAIRGSTRG